MPSLLTHPSPGSQPGSQLSFERRLLLTLGTSLAVAFLVLGVALWFVARGWLWYQARALLLHEASEVATSVVTPGGQLRPQRYAWYEPHHRFAAPRIDPFFLQLFDADGRLLRTSDNVAAVEGGTYPDRLFHRPAVAPPHAFTRLATFRVGSATLYAEVQPLMAPDSTVLGYVQVGRYEPGTAATLRRVTLGIAGGLGGLLLVLLGLVAATARRVVRPLATITEAARGLAPEALHRRIPLPPGSDAETAQLAHTLNGQLDRLEAAFEEAQRFTSNAAHELQTPLTVLRGHVDVALRRPREAASYRQTLRLLGDEIDALSRMVRALLMLARLDRDHYASLFAPVCLTALVDETVRRFRPAAEARGLRLTADLHPAVWVQGQDVLLREAVDNLVDNAIKYTPAGTVHVALHVRDEAAVLHVIDTGPGIPTTHLPHVTDRFYRVADGRNISGSGLGLALADQIAALHGGTLALSSSDAGTTARLTLPGATLDAPPPPRTAQGSTTQVIGK